MHRHNGKQKTGTRSDISEAVRLIAADLGVPELFARILISRGINNADDARVFLKPKLEDLSDPFLLPDMEKGVDRLIGGLTEKEKICLYGDYDADGVTSLALMANFLKHFAVSPVIHIPTRQEGYGLHKETIKTLYEKGVTLLISLDCGSSNVEEVNYAKNYGIDTVIVDHHEMGQIVPQASALINPKRKDSRFPTRDLAACGVTFFFLLALRRTMHRKGLLKEPMNLKRELDIVTVGTVGDMVPLTGDNRIMVRHGMEMMNKSPRAWLKAMHKNKTITKDVIDEFTLGFIIVPRINAAGRVSEPQNAFNFLVSEEEEAAALYLKSLENANRHRQNVEEQIVKKIVNDLRKDRLSEKNSIVVYNEKWHVGVLGIVAQKLAEMYKKPSIVITKIDNTWKGSGRGAKGMDLFETITSLSSLLLKYGGHKYACGISIAEENLCTFADAFEKSIRYDEATQERQEILCDTEAEFEDLTTEFMGYIGQLAPFGVGNPRPNILLKPVDIAPLKYGRVKITDKNKRTWYGHMQPDQTIPRSDMLYCVASPVLREEMGEQFINLNVKEIAETPFLQ